MEEKIKEFIGRRFPIDCDWTTGNCYWFALILSEQFGLDIYYLPIPGHFVAGNGSEFFDYHGKYEIGDEPIILLGELKRLDPLQAKRLEDNCMA